MRPHNPKEDKYRIPTKLSSFKITTDLNNFGKQRRIIEYREGEGYITAKRNLTIFNKNGKVIHKQLQELVNIIQISP